MSSLEVRFWSKIEKTNSCWLWTATVSDGYGKIKIDGKTKSAHRIAYELLIGEIPAGLELDHLCRVRNCVNPTHLEPVTHKINVERGNVGKVTGQLQRAKTHCPRGHEYTISNTRIYNNYRACRQCHRASVRRWKERKKFAIAIK